jgi:hypothetical protein
MEHDNEPSNVDKMFGPFVERDNWTLTIHAVALEVGCAIRAGQFTLPVEVSISSVNDKHLLTYRIESSDASKWGFVLQSDESRWQDPDIFPVTAVVTTGSGDMLEYSVDPRPKKLQ